MERVRQRLVEPGLEVAVQRAANRRHKSRKLDGEGAAHRVARLGSDPPAGRNRGTVPLVAARLVALAQVEAISHEGVRQALKKRT